jgi:hypothetical protein
MIPEAIENQRARRDRIGNGSNKSHNSDRERKKSQRIMGAKKRQPTNGQAALQQIDRLGHNSDCNNKSPGRTKQVTNGRGNKQPGHRVTTLSPRKSGTTGKLPVIT